MALLFQYVINSRSRVDSFLCFWLINKTTTYDISHLARIFHKMNIRINPLFSFSEVLQKRILINHLLLKIFKLFFLPIGSKHTSEVLKDN